MSEKTVNLSIERELILPQVPNYLRIKGLAGGHPSIDVADLSNEDLRKIGKEWTQALIDNAYKRKNRPREER